MIGKQFKAKFLGSLTISDAKEDAADSLKFIRASDLTSGNKQPTVLVTLKLKGISVFAGPTKLAILEAPIERVIFVCHDPEDVTAFGVVIKTQDRGLRLHAFQSDEATAISFVHSSQELFQLALKIVKAKQKLYEQEQQVVQSDLPPPYASIVSGTRLIAATAIAPNSTSEERATTASVLRRKKTSVEGTSAVPRPARRSSMILTDQQKEAPKLFRRATMYSVDQQNEAKRKESIQAMSVQAPFSGLDGASSLFSPPRNAISSPGSVSLGSSDAHYAKIGVAGASSPPQAGFIPQWQSSPLTKNTYLSPIGQNQSPLLAGLTDLDASQASLSLPNPLYNSTALTPSPQNAAEPFPLTLFPSNQLPTISPNQTSNQSTITSLQIASRQRVRATGTDHLLSAQLETGGEGIQRNTCKGVKAMSSMGAVNNLSHTSAGSLEECVPLDSGRQSDSGNFKNAFKDSFRPAQRHSSSENTQPHTSSQAAFKGDLPIQSGPHNTHAPASPFEDDFLPILQANGNESNSPANATTNSTPSAITHMFEDSFTSPPAHLLTGDSFQTSQSFENSFQSSLTFNSFDDNFNTLVSQNIEQQPTFENDFGTSTNSTSFNLNPNAVPNTKNINQQLNVGFEDHFVQ
eukprot:Em0196g4a